MKARIFTEADYETVAGWYRKRGTEPLDRAMFSPGTVMIEDFDGKPLVMVIGYFEEHAPVGVLAWAASDPDAPNRRVHAAFRMAFEAQLFLFRKRGVLLVLSRLAPRGFTAILKRAGFSSGQKMEEVALCLTPLAD